MGTDLQRARDDERPRRPSTAERVPLDLTTDPVLDDDRAAALAQAIEVEDVRLDLPPVTASAWHRAGLIDAVDRAQ